MGTIPEFYRGKCVFLTGGSGFIGKVLIEHLIRSCPDIGNIYVLLRSKRNKSMQERMNELLANNVFNKIRQTHPENLQKLKCVEGDVTKLKLGISHDDYQEIVNRVDIIFHVAATVKFTADLSDAAIINIRGTREICYMALAMKKKPILLHVSTSYSQHENAYIEEKLYKPYGNWKEIIEVAETMDRHTLNILTAKIKGHKINTYTFTKALAEEAVRELCEQKIPTIILRPAIVVGTYKDPFPGFCEGFSGMVGISVGTLKGVLKVLYLSAERCEYIPVDIVAKGLVNSVWKNGHSIGGIAIINGTCSNIIDFNNKSIIKALDEAIPLTKISFNWYPKVIVMNSYICYYLYFFIFQLIPFVFADLLLSVVKRKTYLVNIQRKMFAQLSVLGYFMENDWDIKNDNFTDVLINVPDDCKECALQLGSLETLQRDCALNYLHYMQVNYFNDRLIDHPIKPFKLHILKLLWFLQHGSVFALLGYCAYLILV